MRAEYGEGGWNRGVLSEVYYNLHSFHRVQLQIVVTAVSAFQPPLNKQTHDHLE